MLAAGISLGNYVVEREIGAGGMARVYRVRHVVLGTPHAIKVLEPSFRERAEVRERFLAEGRIAATLQHPNIVRVTDTVATPEVAALVMDLVEGGSLEDYIVHAGQLPSNAEVCALFLPVLSAVGYAHQHGIIHRDIKPANILLAEAPGGIPTPRVTDFGIAKIIREKSTLSQRKQSTHFDAWMGTVAYMSPEQIQTPKQVTPRSDIFSLGATLFELVTGMVAFEGDSDFDVMKNIMDGGRSLRILPDMDPTIAAVLHRALDKDPAKRFASCEEFAAALAPAGSGPHAQRRATRKGWPVSYGQEQEHSEVPEGRAHVESLPTPQRAASDGAVVPPGAPASTPTTGQAPLASVGPPASREAPQPRGTPVYLPVIPLTETRPPSVLQRPGPSRRRLGLVMGGMLLALGGAFVAGWVQSRVRQESGPKPYEGCVQEHGREANAVVVTYLDQNDVRRGNYRSWFPAEVPAQAVRAVYLVKKKSQASRVALMIRRDRWPRWDELIQGLSGPAQCAALGTALNALNVGRPLPNRIRNPGGAKAAYEYDFVDDRALLKGFLQVEDLGALAEAEAEINTRLLPSTDFPGQ